MTQSISRVAKPILHYTSTNEIEALVDRYGTYLDNLTAQQLCLFSGVIADHMAAMTAENEYYTIESSLEVIDPDSLLEQDLSSAVVAVIEESDAETLALLKVAIDYQVYDRARNGAWS